MKNGWNRDRQALRTTLKRGILLLTLALAATTTEAQEEDLRKQYEAFKQQAIQEYNDFRDRANKAYADFMRQAWEEYRRKPEIPKPKDEPPVPPQVFPEEDKDKPLQDNSQPIEEVVPIPTPEPQPKPVAPVREEPQPQETYYTFNFFRTSCKVRLDDRHRFTLKKCNGNTIASAWEQLSNPVYNNAIRDCLELRIRHQLCDWAYLLMLQELTDSFLGKGSNEATLLCAYLYCQSGYKMRLGMRNNRLYLLVASRHQIYERSYWTIDGVAYYPLNCQEEVLEICEAAFPNEQPLSLLVPQVPLLTERFSPSRTLQSERYPDMKVTVSSDETLQQFFSTYPTSMLDNDFCTRWAFYANTPLSERMQHQLYPALKRCIAGKSQAEAVGRLLNFVQTAFVYEYDNKVWGGDRAFFAEESLYYPYCDCEDRSILFSRLVRDLLGLKVMLVYYPGHLATAVGFTQSVNGDYIQVGGRKFTVCDPTYIGAPVGATMPDMDNRSAKVIVLE